MGTYKPEETPVEQFVKGWTTAQQLKQRTDLDVRSVVLTAIQKDYRSKNLSFEEVEQKILGVLQGEKGAELQGYLSAFVADPQKIPLVLGCRKRRGNYVV
jgi:hypothetical protein